MCIDDEDNINGFVDDGSEQASTDQDGIDLSQMALMLLMMKMHRACSPLGRVVSDAMAEPGRHAAAKEPVEIRAA
jgi:hypothetical protein